ncbi:MAG TPA: TIGR01777 family oxidoreductase [Candidatus Eisenbacteria bacterium]|nr:TIGR01777 family oxidoreductase [Candidatus Eisenbacteria bacterium]
MKVIVGGASGLIGTSLSRLLRDEGHQVLRLVRGRPARDASEVAWDPDAGRIDAAALEDVDAAVNLAGATIARWPFNEAHKRRVLQSRTRSAALLARAIAETSRGPRVLLAASATGYYGSRGDELLDERSAHGSGFLAGVCRAWESATDPASQAGVRVVTARFGIVLSAAGGAFAAMKKPFQLGLGGRIGSGNQWMSWVSSGDAVRAVLHAIEHEELRGPVNVTSPEPVTNADLTKALGRVLRRPTPVPLPAAVARLLLGELAEETLLASQRVMPARLVESGFEFREPRLEPALRAAFAR